MNTWGYLDLESQVLFSPSMSNPHDLAKSIKQLSREVGFQFCGIAKAEYLSDEAKRTENWLKRGYQGKMSVYILFVSGFIFLVIGDWPLQSAL